VHRHVRAQLLGEPGTFLGDLVVAVIVAGDEQSGDLEPDVRGMAQVLQRVQYRLQVPGRDAVVEVVGERLEVDVGGVEVGEQLPSGSSVM